MICQIDGAKLPLLRRDLRYTFDTNYVPREVGLSFISLNKKNIKGVPKGNKSAIARFLNRKYPGHYRSHSSARRAVQQTLNNIGSKWEADSTQNPLRDGRSTCRHPRRVSSNQHIRNAVEERIGSTTSRSLATGQCWCWCWCWC